MVIAELHLDKQKPICTNSYASVLYESKQNYIMLIKFYVWHIESNLHFLLNQSILCDAVDC